MSTILAENLSNLSGANTVPVSTVSSCTPKAWVTFRGSAASVAPIRGFNISSITDRGIGLHTLNFTNAMNSADYGVVGTMECNTGVDTNIYGCKYYARTTTSVQTMGMYAGGSYGIHDGANSVTYVILEK